MPDIRDALQWKSPYWESYANLTSETQEEMQVVKEIIEEAKEEAIPYVPEEVSN